MKTLIVIVGPTASGKTSLAVKVAKHFNAEIISADSRQLFKEMTIGTAKPSQEEMESVKHHLIDSHSINEEYSIAKFEQEALEILGDIFLTQDIAIAVGGSGLYVKILTEGMDEIPDVDPEIKEELNQLVAEGKFPDLLEELKNVDPVYYEKVDRANTHRVIRGIEVFRSTGIPFSQFRTGQKKSRPFKIVKIGLLWEREELYERIDRRMDQMIEAGLFEEAKLLYPFKNRTALQTVGYQEIFDYFDGKYDRAEAIRLLKRNSRRYAKRQMTWFNKDKEINWFKAGDEKLIVEFIEKQLAIGS